MPPKTFYVLARNLRSFKNWRTAAPRKGDGHHYIFIGSVVKLKGLRLTREQLILVRGWQHNPVYTSRFQHTLEDTMLMTQLQSNQQSKPDEVVKRLYASLTGPLLGLYYPLPLTFGAGFVDELTARLMLNSSRLSKLWCGIYTEQEVDDSIAKFGGTKLPARQYAHLDYDTHKVCVGLRSENLKSECESAGIVSP